MRPRRARMIAAVHAAAFFFLIGCGESDRDGFPIRIEPAGTNRLFLCGEEVARGATIEAAPGGALRIDGRLFDPAWGCVEGSPGAKEAERLYGAVPSVSAASASGTPLPEAAERFRARVRRIRAEASRAWLGAIGRGATPEEAAAAAIRSIGEEERALLDGEPSMSPSGILSIRFQGRPPELWVLRSAADRPAIVEARARDFAARLVRFLEGPSPRAVLLGEGVLWLEGKEAEEAVRRMEEGGPAGARPE
ncbi:MAG: hypothetical protein JW958_10035 [Candidatus Eisenbacteria bacterium]|nr:hypothetical protein [Candidatus Eisenbacteria bacterium]